MISTSLVVESIEDFDADRLHEFVDKMRQRRLEAYNLYVEACRRKAEEKVAKIRDKYEQQARLLKKDIDALDKKLEAIDKRILKIRALQIEFAPLNKEITL